MTQGQSITSQAAKLARSEPLAKLYEVVENQKTIKTTELVKLLDEASGKLRAISRVLVEVLHRDE